jgi:hypothetical protein
MAKKSWLEALTALEKKPLAKSPGERLIEALRQALAVYDHETGKHRRVVTAEQVNHALEDFDSGMSIRKAARINGISFGTLWTAKERRAGRPG